MTEPELLQLIDRIQNDLDNNWAVDADDIRALLELAKSNVQIMHDGHTAYHKIETPRIARYIRVSNEDSANKELINHIIKPNPMKSDNNKIIGSRYLCQDVKHLKTSTNDGTELNPKSRSMTFEIQLLSSGDVSSISDEDVRNEILKILTLCTLTISK